MIIDTKIDERTLHEIYPSAFEIAVKSPAVDCHVCIQQAQRCLRI